MFQCKRTTLGAAACVVLLLIVAPAAFAQSAAESGYSEPAGSVEHKLGRADVQRSSSTVDPKNDPRSLPFTGFDLGLVGAAGGLLLLVGLAVRRAVGSATP